MDYNDDDEFIMNIEILVRL